MAKRLTIGERVDEFCQTAERSEILMLRERLDVWIKARWPGEAKRPRRGRPKAVPPETVATQPANCGGTL